MKNLIGKSGGSFEDQNYDNSKDKKGQVHELAVGNKDSVWKWTRGDIFYILAKNLPMFCPFDEAEFKCGELVWQRKFHDSQIFRLRYRYYRLLLVRPTVRIKNEQYENYAAWLEKKNV